MHVQFTIRAKILLALCFVIVVMGSINAALMFQALNVSQQYDAIITNISTANSISSVKTDIDSAMWAIVAGNVDFDGGKQYAIIDDVNDKLYWMRAHTESDRAATKLDVIVRAMQTLRQNVDRMGDQMRLGSAAAANEQLLEEMRFDSSVVEDLVHDYVLFEVQRTDRQYEQMRAGLTSWVVWYLVLTCSGIAFAIVAAWRISRGIYLPIKKLHDVTNTITRDDLQALITRTNVDEITELGMSFNVMV